MNNAIEGMHIDRAIEGMHIDRAIEGMHIDRAREGMHIDKAIRIRIRISLSNRGPTRGKVITVIYKQ